MLVHQLVYQTKIQGPGRTDRGTRSLKLGSGAPGKIRTPDPLIRSQVLYPAELPVRTPPERRNCHTGLSSIMQARASRHRLYSAFGNWLR